MALMETFSIFTLFLRDSPTKIEEIIRICHSIFTRGKSDN